MRILLPVNASQYSAQAVHEVTKRPWPAGTRVRVLSAVEPMPPPAMGPLMFDAAGSLDRLERQRTKAANRLAERVAHSLAARGLKADTAVLGGDPRSVIVDEAKKWKADLIVLGSNHHTGIEKWLLGSVAQSVVSHAPCSVEVVRRKSMKG